jgi:hypothetical protein
MQNFEENTVERFLQKYPAWRGREIPAEHIKWFLESELDAKKELDFLLVRKKLMKAARVVRSLGFAVRSSKDRAGKVSSYYFKINGETVRISDHEIPLTQARVDRGLFSGFHGEELIVNSGTTKEEVVNFIKSVESKM